MGVIPPSVWEKQHKEDEESSILDSEFLQGDIGVEGNIAPQPDDEKRNNDKNNRKRWFNFFFRRRTRKSWLLSKNNCIGFFNTFGKQRQNLFPVIFRPCSFCRRVSKTKKTGEKWWRLHTFLFQFPNCGKTPCQAFRHNKTWWCCNRSSDCPQGLCRTRIPCFYKLYKPWDGASDRIFGTTSLCCKQ